MHYRSKLGPPWFEIQCLLNSSKIIDFNFNEYICVARSFAQLLGFFLSNHSDFIISKRISSFKKENKFLEKRMITHDEMVKFIHVGHHHNKLTIF